MRGTWKMCSISLLAVLIAGAAVTARGAGVDATPVLVELFTSQGCSSCPPADRLLSKLGHDGAGGPVIPLAFHVDYWNHLGWSDPFSSPRWSARQESYARAFRSNRIYTPELVVNGHDECVGSQREEVLRKIAAARAAGAAARLALAVEPAGAGSLKVKVGARMLRPTGSGSLELWVALTQSGLSTPVKAGENAASTLHNDFVVRRLEKALALAGSAGSERAGELTLDLEPALRTGRLAVVAFLQDPATLAIYGAAAQQVR